MLSSMSGTLRLGYVSAHSKGASACSLSQTRRRTTQSTMCSPASPYLFPLPTNHNPLLSPMHALAVVPTQKTFSNNGQAHTRTPASHHVDSTTFHRLTRLVMRTTSVVTRICHAVLKQACTRSMTPRKHTAAGVGRRRTRGKARVFGGVSSAVGSWRLVTRQEGICRQAMPVWDKAVRTSRCSVWEFGAGGAAWSVGRVSRSEVFERE